MGYTRPADKTTLVRGSVATRNANRSTANRRPSSGSGGLRMVPISTLPRVVSPPSTRGGKLPGRGVRLLSDMTTMRLGGPAADGGHGNLPVGGH